MATSPDDTDEDDKALAFKCSLRDQPEIQNEYNWKLKYTKT